MNLAYFDNKQVPPLAILVSGGARLTPGTVKRIERFISERIRGRGNFWSLLVLQAENDPKAAKTGRAPNIELKPLTSAQINDAIHQAYDERNIDKVGAQFRLPRLLRGDARDFNRATAEASLRFAEDQVFAPERELFDAFMNRFVMPALKVGMWTFRSQTLTPRDPERLTDMTEKLVKVGVLTPEDGRRIAEDIFNTDLPPLEEDWGKRPLVLTLAGIQTSQRPPDVTRSVEGKLALIESELGAERDAHQMTLFRELMSSEQHVQSDEDTGDDVGAECD